MRGSCQRPSARNRVGGRVLSCRGEGSREQTRKAIAAASFGRMRRARLEPATDTGTPSLRVPVAASPFRRSVDGEVRPVDDDARCATNRATRNGSAVACRAYGRGGFRERESAHRRGAAAAWRQPSKGGVIFLVFVGSILSYARVDIHMVEARSFERRGSRRLGQWEWSRGGGQEPSSASRSGPWSSARRLARLSTWFKHAGRIGSRQVRDGPLRALDAGPRPVVLRAPHPRGA